VSYDFRDLLGRIEQKTETIQGTTTVWNYTYDEAGRLWQVMQNGVLTATYLYDSNGNRLSKTTTSGAEIGTYDAQDRLLTYGKWSYTYTANGDLQTKTDTSSGQVTTYDYDALGNLRHVGLPDGRSIDLRRSWELTRRRSLKVTQAWITERSAGSGSASGIGDSGTCGEAARPGWPMYQDRVLQPRAHRVEARRPEALPPWRQVSGHARIRRASCRRWGRRDCWLGQRQVALPR
jgi:hypothetical protein